MSLIMDEVRCNWVRGFYLSLGMMVFGLLATSCSTLGGQPDAGEPEDLKINVTLNKSAYRPGEVMVINVTLSNVSGETQPVRMLDAESLEFWFGLKGSAETPIRREAVYSLRERMDEYGSLASGQTVQRQLLLTRLTHYRGPMVAQAHYKRGVSIEAMKTNKIYSNVVEYEVHGERLFEREDARGIIVKEAAISLARAQVPRRTKVMETQALLVEDEKGFYCYWVNLNVNNGKGETGMVSYLVDPYKGKVKGQAKPFDSKSLNAPRFKRPGTLPQKGMPSHQVGEPN